MKNSLLAILFLSTVSFLLAQPTVDGTTSDAAYTTTMTYTSGRDGFGSTNNIGHLKFYADGTNLYIGIESKLETNGNRIILFLDFSGYNGRAAGNALGTFASAAGVIAKSNNTNIRLGMEVDYVFEFNTGGGGGCYFDANREGTTGFFNAGTYVGASDLSGTPATPTGLNTNVFNTATPNVTFAYNNGGGANQGLELKVPLASLPGVDQSQTVQLFAIIAGNGNATFFSNECIPGDAGASNTGTNPDLTSLTGSSELALPVELTSFTASNSSKGIVLRWRTATEVNNAGFAVQRKNGNLWTDLGFVSGHGTTNAPQSYEFADNAVSSGSFGYRLKQVDRDGSFSYSPVVEASIALSAADLTLSQNFPNPFNPTTTFTFAVKERQPVQLKVFDLLGKEVASIVDGVVEPNVLQRVTFDGSRLASGVYFYSLRTPDRHEIRRFTLLK